ncbi:MAG: archease [Candidatus Omnitrophota bacterium]
MKPYELIDHTADIGIRAFGKSLEELFAHAAIGMFEIMADLENVTPTQTLRILLKSPDVENLYLLWHQELLYHSAVKSVLYKEFVFDALTETHLEAEARGEEIRFEKHRLKKEIKAATYHGLKVAKSDEGWMGELIFDI